VCQGRTKIQATFFVHFQAVLENLGRFQVLLEDCQALDLFQYPKKVLSVQRLNAAEQVLVHRVYELKASDLF